MPNGKKSGKKGKGSGSKNASKSTTTKSAATGKPAAAKPKVCPIASAQVRAQTGAESVATGSTPLHIAARHGHLDVVKLLLSAGGTHVAAVDGKGRTALMEATLHGQLDVVKSMLKDKRCARTAAIMDGDGQAPLLAAVQYGHNDIVKVLLDCKHVDPAMIGYSYMPMLNRTAAPTLKPTQHAPSLDASAPDAPHVIAASATLTVNVSATQPAPAPLVAPPTPSASAPAANARDALAARAGGHHSGHTGGREGSEAVLQPPHATAPAGSTPEMVDLVACMPLHLAAGLGNADAVRMLLQHPSTAALPSRLDPEMSLLSMFVLQAPLHHAVQAGSTECVHLLLEAGLSVNGTTARLQRTPLHLAALHGHMDIVQLLLEHGADPLATASNPCGESGMETGFTPLSLMLNDWAPRPPGADVAIARLLLDVAGQAGRVSSLLNARTSIMARSALHIAVAKCPHEERAAEKEAVIELLLDQPDLDVNAADALGNSALMLAAAQLPLQGPAAASLLLTHARINVRLADPHLTKTALHYAAEFGGLAVVQACTAVDSSMLNERDTTRLTPLMLAARGGHVPVLEYMLQQRVLACDARDWQGRTAMHQAALSGSAAAVGALCQHADLLDINAVDANAQTALHLAAAAGAASIVEALLDTAGIDLTAGSQSETPMHYACSAGGTGDPVSTVSRLGQEWQAQQANLPELCRWLGQSLPPSGPDDAVKASLPLLHALADTHQAPEKTAEQCGAMLRYLGTILGPSGLHARAADGSSCLQAAIGKGNKPLVFALLDPANSSDDDVLTLVRMADGDGLTALHTCARLGHVELARQVLTIDPALCNSTATDGTTPLMHAASCKRAKFIVCCLMLGTTSAAMDCKASHIGDDASTVEACAEQGKQLSGVVVDVLAQCQLGRTALHYAACENDAASAVAILSLQPVMPDRHSQRLSADDMLKMQKRLWATYDYGSPPCTAADLALTASNWDALRVLVSCKGADLLLHRPAGPRLVKQLRGTPLAEHTAVQQVLSQLAYEQLLQEEAEPAESKAVRDARKKAKRQAKANKASIAAAESEKSKGHEVLELADRTNHDPPEATLPDQAAHSGAAASEEMALAGSECDDEEWQLRQLQMHRMTRSASNVTQVSAASQDRMQSPGQSTRAAPTTTKRQPNSRKRSDGPPKVPLGRSDRGCTGEDAAPVSAGRSGQPQARSHGTLICKSSTGQATQRKPTDATQCRPRHAAVTAAPMTSCMPPDAPVGMTPVWGGSSSARSSSDLGRRPLPADKTQTDQALLADSLSDSASWPTLGAQAAKACRPSGTKKPHFEAPCKRAVRASRHANAGSKQDSDMLTCASSRAQSGPADVEMSSSSRVSSREQSQPADIEMSSYAPSATPEQSSPRSKSPCVGTAALGPRQHIAASARYEEQCGQHQTRHACPAGGVLPMPFPVAPDQVQVQTVAAECNPGQLRAEDVQYLREELERDLSALSSTSLPTRPHLLVQSSKPDQYAEGKDGATLVHSSYSKYSYDGLQAVSQLGAGALTPTQPQRSENLSSVQYASKPWQPHRGGDALWGSTRWTSQQRCSSSNCDQEICFHSSTDFGLPDPAQRATPAPVAILTPEQAAGWHPFGQRGGAEKSVSAAQVDFHSILQHALDDAPLESLWASDCCAAPAAAQHANHCKECASEAFGDCSGAPSGWNLFEGNSLCAAQLSGPARTQQQEKVHEPMPEWALPSAHQPVGTLIEGRFVV